MSATAVDGSYAIELEPRFDERGFFARAFDAELFRGHGMVPDIAQMNYSHSDHRGTLRGLHWQAPPNAEARVVRCVRGAIYDVVADVRDGSPTRGMWNAVELSADNRMAVYVPPGVAHGFLTLRDDCDVLYQASAPYAPESERGARWDDPELGIDWPFEPSIITDKDATWPNLSEGVRQ